MTFIEKIEYTQMQKSKQNSLQEGYYCELTDGKQNEKS